jgi:hypothetical protein
VRASLPNLIQVLHAQKPPLQIWQEPQEYGSRHCERLCRLRGAPDGWDLREYAQDLLYAPAQPDLFRYLLPICLDAWQKDLLSNHSTEYVGFVEYFWAALANRPVLQDCLTPLQYAAVAQHMADSLLDRIDQENKLHCAGGPHRCHNWVPALGSYCVVFDKLPSLWQSWWEMTTLGQACAALKYLSCLLYEDDQNPIFAPWAPDRGCGPFVLWELEGHIYERAWRPENVAFLQATLTMDYVEEKLRHAAQTVAGEVDSPVPERMIADFPLQKTLLEFRLEEQPTLLLASPMYHWDWTI